MALKRFVSMEEIAPKVRDIGRLCNVELQLSQENCYFSKKFKANTVAYSIGLKFSPDSNVQTITSTIDAIMEVMCEVIKRGTSPNEYVGVTIHSPNSKQDAYLIPQRVGNINGGILADKLLSITQSNSSFLNGNGNFLIKVTHLLDVNDEDEPITGSKWLKQTQDFTDWFSRKKCFFKINGNLCLPRALLAAKYIVENRTSSNAFRAKLVRLSRSDDCFKEDATQLCGVSGVSGPEFGCAELDRFMVHLSGYRAHIYSAEHLNRHVHTSGE